MIVSFSIASAPPTAPHLGFIPIETMNVPNSTVSLVFASFDGYSMVPSDDPWLPSHKDFQLSINDPGFPPRNVTVYTPDKPVNILGCTEQHQFCNPNRPMDSESRCTPLMDWGTLALLFDNYTSEILDTTHQVEALTIIMFAALAAELRVSFPFRCKYRSP